MRLHIVRHGQTHWNAIRRIQGQLDSELDETGFEQARVRGKDFINTSFTSAYCSSSLRTRQTIEHLLGDRLSNGLVDQSYPVNYMDKLREICLGVWQGNLWSDIAEKYPDMVEAHTKARDDFSVEGAESTQQLQIRGVEAIENIIALEQSKLKSDAMLANDEIDVLVVSHGAIMKTILAHYVSAPLTELHTLPSLPNCAHCILDASGNQRTTIQIAGEPLANTQWSSYM